LLPIRRFDDQIRLTEQFAAAIEDRRDSTFVQHSTLAMVRQPIFGILAGYEDQNDHDTLQSDPVFKVIADRLPDDPDLSTCDTAGLPPFASQPVSCVIASYRDRRIGTMLTTRARFDAHVPPDCVIASSQRPSIRITGTNGTCAARSRSASSLPFCVISTRRHPLRPVKRIGPAVKKGDAGRIGHARGKECIIRAA
jgi:hypothetical protein